VLGPLLFTIYISPIASIISSLGVHQQQYADDTQLYIGISHSSSGHDLHVLESALSYLASWISHNGLALNPSKSDAILLGTHKRNSSLSTVSNINVAGSIVPLATHIKLLGVTLDNSLTFQKHVKLVSQSCFFHIKALHHIRHTLDIQTASLFGHALTSSRLDYANSILYGAKSSIHTLQKIQNSLTRVVLQSDRSAPSSSLLTHLHYYQSMKELPLATLAFKAQTTSTPAYLSTLLHPYNPTRQLRSSSQSLLQPHSSHTAFGARAFRAAAPSVLNSLPIHVQSASSLPIFKRSLKAHLFK